MLPKYMYKCIEAHLSGGWGWVIPGGGLPANPPTPMLFSAWISKITCLSSIWSACVLQNEKVTPPPKKKQKKEQKKERKTCKSCLPFCAYQASQWRRCLKHFNRRWKAKDVNTRFYDVVELTPNIQDGDDQSPLCSNCDIVYYRCGLCR